MRTRPWNDEPPEPTPVRPPKVQPGEPTPKSLQPYRPGWFFRAWIWLLVWTFAAMLLTGAVIGIGSLLYAIEH